MAEQASQGAGKTTIVLALIGGAQAIFLALIGSGQISFGKASEKTVAAIERSATQDYLPLKITTGAISFKAEAQLQVPSCLQRSQRALELAEFSPTVSGEDDAIRMTRGPVTALVWCDPSVMALAAAGPSTSDPNVTLDLMQRTLGAAFREELAE